MRVKQYWRAAAAALWCIAMAAEAESPSRSNSLADLSLEELSNLEITSVSRRAEPLSDAAASVFVITGQDIRRSGATTLPEALRLAPNLQVARIDARQYAITSRGFNGTAASNKLLVLIDGRSVYTPLFSGVFWDAQDVLLEDIDRIEVISGPGGTLWGTNAVNGVINIISRVSSQTQGTFAFLGAGNTERGTAVRHGGRLGSNGSYRVYGKFFDWDDTVRADGGSAADAWKRGQVGFRSDWALGADALTLQGDAYDGTSEQVAPGKTTLSGANLLGRWSRRFSSGSSLHVQAYVDTRDRDIPGTFKEHRTTRDLEFHHTFAAGQRHIVTWGGEYRAADDHATNSAVLAFLPADKRLHWTSVFAQDEIRVRNNLQLTLGSKLENNPYTGTEALPSARLAWKPDERRLVWTAVSRAVRAPSRIDREFFAPAQPPFVLAGGPDFRSEIVNVFELGYRVQASQRLTYSITAFHSVYKDLRSLARTASGALVIANEMEGTSDGLESWVNVQMNTRWRLSAGGFLMRHDLRLKSRSAEASTASAGNDPEHQVLLRSSHDLTDRQQLDVMVRHVGALPNPAVPAYTSADVQYAYRIQRGLQLSATARNLLDRRHPEFGALPARSEFGRMLFLALRWSQ
jgi:iron complex outermembrane recepter protein